MSGSLAGRRAAFLVAEGAEQVELTEPSRVVAEAGAAALLVSTAAGQVQAFNHLDRADKFDVDRVVRCDCGPSILLSSRKPDDLPAFCDAIVEELATQGATR